MPESSTETQHEAEKEEKPGSEAEGQEISAEIEHEHEGAEEHEVESPTIQDEKKPESIHEAVQAALEKTSKEQSSSPKTDKKDESENVDKTSDAEKLKEDEAKELSELTDAELKAYKPKTQRRIKDFQRKIGDLETKYQDAYEKVEKFEKICRDNNLTEQEVIGGLNIVIASKNNPSKALEMILPLADALKTLSGDNLPADIQKDVTDGKISVERGKELSKLRAGNAISTFKEKETTQKNQTEQIKKLGVDAGNAVKNWEDQQKKIDPDYRVKQARISEAIKLDMLERREAQTLPKNPDEAVKICQGIKEKIDKEFSSFLPKKQQVVSVNEGARGSTRPAAVRPKNMLEVVDQALGL